MENRCWDMTEVLNLASGGKNDLEKKAKKNIDMLDLQPGEG